MSTASRWLNWTPNQPEIMRPFPEIEPTKPTKLSFHSFDGSPSVEKQIIRESDPGNPEEDLTPKLFPGHWRIPIHPCTVCHSPRLWISFHNVIVCAICHPPADRRLIRKWIDLSQPAKRKQSSLHHGESRVCPYSLPEGVKLIRFDKKRPPVAIRSFSIVNDLNKFIRHALDELDARLRRPSQIKAGDSVFQLLSKLADCGLEVRLEWPPNRETMHDSCETEPSRFGKASESFQANAAGLESNDEDVPS